MRKLRQPNLAVLLDSWEIHLRSERKSPRTITSYTSGVRAYLGWAAAGGREPVIERRAVAAFVASILEAGREASTAASRQMAVRRFSAWLADEGELDADPLLGMKPPKIDTKVVEPLTEDQLRAMLRACAGKEFRDRRDEALIRFMLETGTRAGEVLNLTVADLDLSRGIAVVRRGKGGKGRVVPFGPQTARAMDRYKRARAAHKLAAAPMFWLGDRGREFGYHGLHKALKSRAEAAGIAGFHPHAMRHTAAHRWLAAGGSEGGLMAMAGWSKSDMLRRYTNARASERAADEARKLNLGDL